MVIPMPVDYIHEESGERVTVTLVTNAMSMIGPDYFELDLSIGDYVIDFPDRTVKVVTEKQLLEEYTRVPPKTAWRDIDEARSFAQEMQYAIDHPEEFEGKPLKPEEIAQIRSYIRSAKEYLAERDESL